MKRVFEIRAIAVSDDAETLSKPISTSEKNKMEVEQVKTNEEVASTDINRSFTKVISTIAVVHSTAQTLSQPIIQAQMNKASVAGDYVQAENIRRTQAITNQAIGLGLEIAAIGAAAVYAPPLAIGMAAMTVGKYVQQGINREQTNRANEAMNNIENFINSYESARLINVKAGR